MTTIFKTYKWIIDDLGDPRVKKWPLMESPIPCIFMIVFYLYIVKSYLPAWMKDRPAYSLKTIINIYNVFQVFINAILFHGLLTSGWTTTMHLGCLMPDHSENPEAISMASWMWWTMLLKAVEFIETIFFIMRKKDNQASFLHVYHHVISLMIMWIAVKYLPGGMASLTPLINTFVHVIMYSYYLISSLAGPKLRAKLNKWKMWLTIVQMIQFTILLIHSLQALAPSCPAPMVITWIYLPNLLFVYYLFIIFFIKSYSKKSKQT